MPLKLKTEEVGGKVYALVQDGRPVYVDDAGKEITYDAEHSTGVIGRLTNEAKTHREAKEAFENKLKAFEGIEDAEAAKRAIETVKNLDQGQLVTAGKVEEIKNAANKAAEERVAAAAKASNTRIKELEETNGKLTGDFFAEKVGGSFSRSKYVAEKIAVPSDMLQAMFGNRFKVENGKVIGQGLDNQPIYSKTRGGEIADFDEALESMVEAYPHRDAILKGTGSSGSGARQGNGLANGGAKTMTQAAFDALAPMQQAALMNSKDRPQIV